MCFCGFAISQKNSRAINTIQLQWSIWAIDAKLAYIYFLANSEMEKQCNIYIATTSESFIHRAEKADFFVCLSVRQKMCTLTSVRVSMHNKKALQRKKDLR